MNNSDFVNYQGQAVIISGKLGETKEDIDLLNDLIATNRSMIEVYQTAVAQLDDETNVEILQRYGQQHEEFVTELSNLVAGYGGAPTTSAETSSLVKRAWVTLKATVTEGDGPILTTVTRDAENVLEVYGEAMGEDLPENARDVVRRHLSRVRLAYEKLSGLSGAYDS